MATLTLPRVGSFSKPTPAGHYALTYAPWDSLPLWCRPNSFVNRWHRATVEPIIGAKGSLFGFRIRTACGIQTGGNPRGEVFKTALDTDVEQECKRCQKVLAVRPHEVPFTQE